MSMRSVSRRTSMLPYLRCGLALRSESSSVKEGCEVSSVSTSFCLERSALSFKLINYIYEKASQNTHNKGDSILCCFVSILPAINSESISILLHFRLLSCQRFLCLHGISSLLLWGIGLLQLFKDFLSFIWVVFFGGEDFVEGSIVELGILKFCHSRGGFMKNNEVFREYFRCGEHFKSFIIPFLAMLNLTASSTEILRFMYGQFATPSVHLPLNQPQVRPLLVFLTSKSARIVELSITYRVDSYHLH